MIRPIDIAIHRSALADLEARTVAADGGRLKLEWGVLDRRPPGVLQDLGWWEGERLAGFAGVYAFGATPEIAGMVDPARRRRGIGRALVRAAAELTGAATRALLVVPRTTGAGPAFATALGGQLDHTEHALAVSVAPPAPDGSPATAVRNATPADVGDLTRLLTDAFGSPPPPGMFDRLSSADERSLVVEVEGDVVGTLRIDRSGDRAGVYGFAVDPRWQGRGIGRTVLAATCRDLFDDGVTRVHLEVEVDNDRALGLYTALGFRQVTTEDYFAIALTAPAPTP